MTKNIFFSETHFGDWLPFSLPPIEQKWNTFWGLHQLREKKALRCNTFWGPLTFYTGLWGPGIHETHFQDIFALLFSPLSLEIQGCLLSRLHHMEVQSKWQDFCRESFKFAQVAFSTKIKWMSNSQRLYPSSFWTHIVLRSGEKHNCPEGQW